MTQFELTPCQYAVFAKELAAPGTDINNLYFLLRLRGEPDVPRLERAVNDFVRANEAARTVITVTDGVPRQSFAPYAPFKLPVLDLTACTDDEAAARLDDEGRRPFTPGGSLCEFAAVLLPAGGGLYCKFSHVWTDGWGCGLIWSEILRRYAGGEPAAGVPFSFTPTFIAAQNRAGDGAQAAADAEFWRGYLAGLQTGEVEAAYDTAADRTERRLPPELCASIAAFAAREKLKPGTVFLTALGLYVRGAAGCDDVLLGTARLNRDTAAERMSVGMFVTEIPVRLKLPAGLTFADACRVAEQSTGAAAAHKKYPLGEILAQLRREQNIVCNPLQYSLSFQKTRVGADESAEVIFGRPAHADSRLVLHVVDYGGTGDYKLYIDWQRAFYNERTARYFLDSMEMILREGTGARGFAAGDCVTGAAERAELAALGRGAKLAARMTFPALWRARVAEDPAAVAVTDGTRVLTRAAAEESALCTAARLQAAGIGKGDVAAVLLPRGCELLTATLGVLAAGCAFLWLDASFPDERLNLLVADSGAGALVTDAAGAERIAAHGLSVVIAGDAAGGACPRFTPVEVTADDLAYLIYTSGTTGRPKGAELTHGGLANFCARGSSAFVDSLAACKRALCIGSVSFDICVSECLPALANGVAVCIADEETRRDPLKLADFMLKENVDALQSTPSRLLTLLGGEKFRLAVSRLSLVLSAGEDFPPALLARLREAGADCAVFNGYGPTETTVGAAYYRVTDGDVALGEPVANTTLSVRAANSQPLPFGWAGELWIGGAGVAKGYRGLPDLTAEKFVCEGDERLYRTGDIVLRRPDGALVFRGRRDDQIKVRGQRVELAEIDARILECAGVAECATIFKKQNGGGFLCAFCRRAAGAEVTEREIFAHLKKNLPDYMLPAALVFLAELPKTPAGKTDGRALAAIEVAPKREFVPPATDDERTLCGLMAKTLGLDAVGAEDSFFDLGGDSLAAATFLLEAAAHGFTFSYADIFRTPTVRGLLFATAAPPVPPKADYADTAAFDLSWPSAPPAPCGKRTVLLTGATGYLGLHVLRELIENTDDEIICLVRPGRTAPEKRLRNLLYYYFEDNFAAAFGSRVRVAAGDLTTAEIFADPLADKIDLAINCAADVAHFTHGDKMRRLNVEGTEKLLAYCAERGAAFAQISTVSVVQFVGDAALAARAADESDLWFGQDFRNEYIESKFLAERAVLAARGRGMDACVLRVGNLQGRAADGEFQINGKSNAFASELKAHAKLGAAPASLLGESVDVSPVDDTARAIRLLLGLRPTMPVYHVFSDKPVAYADIYAALAAAGHPVSELSDADYRRLLTGVLGDAEKRGVLADIIPQINADAEKVFPVPVSCARTAALLRTLGFGWTEIGGAYLGKFFRALEGLGFFE